MTWVVPFFSTGNSWSLALTETYAIAVDSGTENQTYVTVELKQRLAVEAQQLLFFSRTRMKPIRDSWKVNLGHQVKNDLPVAIKKECNQNTWLPTTNVAKFMVDFVD